jgi:hypothetical protein
LYTKAESFSFASLSTAKEKDYFLLCDLCGSSEAGLGFHFLTRSAKLMV